MILTDGTNTFTTTYEDIEEELIENGNIEVTLGGMPKSQTDSQRLKIKSSLRLTAAEYISLKAILTNWAAPLTYTPSRVLLGKSTAAAMGVVRTSPPSVKQRAWNGAIIYYIDLEFEEDIYA